MVTENIEAISDLEVLSSKYFLSSTTYRAAARTGVGDFFLCLRNPLAFGSGNIWDLQNIIMSWWPSCVVFIAGSGGGVDSGEMVPIGRESCRVGGTVAAKMRVICSGVTAVASSASPFATWARAEWAFARSEKRWL